MKLVICENCGQTTAKPTSRYNESIKNGWNFFCSIKCRYEIKEKGNNFHCAWCAKIVRKTPAELRKTKFNIFCNKSCAASFNNRNKTSGIRRSKLEEYLENQAIQFFPKLEIICNSNKIIGLELDFYFPTLKLAIELNGHLHYQPIYGQEKLNRIQALDKEKLEKCKMLGINLQVFDVSCDLHFTNEVKIKNWQKFRELIISALNYAELTN